MPGAARGDAPTPSSSPTCTRACDAAELWSTDQDRGRLLAEVAATCRQLADGPGTSPGGAARRWPGPPATSTRSPGCGRPPATTSTCTGGHWCARPSWARSTTAEVDGAARAGPGPGRLGARAGRCGRRHPSVPEKEEVWQTLLGRTVPVSSVGNVATAFWRPGQAEVLAPFVERYLEAAAPVPRGRHDPGDGLQRAAASRSSGSTSPTSTGSSGPRRRPSRSCTRRSSSAPTASGGCFGRGLADPSHLLGRRDPQQSQPGHEHVEGHPAQPQP